MSAQPPSPNRTRHAAVIGLVVVLSVALAGIAVAQSPFTDISGNTHEHNIDLAHELGITVGTTPETYSPAADVRRDQMASFLINTLEHAHPQIEVEWLLEQVSNAFVLPDGTTFTDEDEPMEEPGEDELPPVGSRLFLAEDVWSVDANGDPDTVIGTDHVVCTAGVEPGRFTCEVAFEIDGEGSLFAVTTFSFFDFDDEDAFTIDLAVTAGTGNFYGATGELTFPEEDEDLGRVTGTLVLHGTR